MLECSWVEYFMYSQRILKKNRSGFFWVPFSIYFGLFQVLEHCEMFILELEQLSFHELPVMRHTTFQSMVDP